MAAQNLPNQARADCLVTHQLAGRDPESELISASRKAVDRLSFQGLTD